MTVILDICVISQSHNKIYFAKRSANMENKSNSNQSNRVSIIETVQTPLGFFTLAVLIVEAILGVSANLSQGSDRSNLFVWMIVLIFLLVALVAGLAIFRPEA